MERTGETDTRTETTDKPTSPERPYTPPPDNPGSPGQPSRLESRARAREQPAAQDVDRDDEFSPSQPEASADSSGAPETSDQEKDAPQKNDDPTGELPEEGTRDPEELAPDEAEPGDRRPGTEEARADNNAPDDDRGKKAEDDDAEQIPNEASETDPEAPANPVLTNVYTDSRGNVRIEPRYGREQPAEPTPRESQNADRPGLPTREDLDPAGANPEPGHADLRNPEDDPENQDLLDRDAEGLARWKKTGREFVRRPDDVAKTTEALAKDIDKLVKWDRPTGVAESKPAIEVKPHHDSIQGANAAIGVLGTGIILYEIARRARVGLRNIREKMTGAGSAHN